MTNTGCTRRVSLDSWHFADCGKPVKGEGLCPSHLAGKKRSEAATTKNNEQAGINEGVRLRAIAIGKSMAIYGIASTPEYDRNGHRYTGKVVVDGEAVLKALKDMAATR